MWSNFIFKHSIKLLWNDKETERRLYHTIEIYDWSDDIRVKFSLKWSRFTYQDKIQDTSVCYGQFSLMISLLKFEVEGFEEILTSVVSSVPFFKKLSRATPRASHPSWNGKPRSVFKAFFQLLNPALTKACFTLFVDIKLTDKVLMWGK